jgi:hypothetical protein
VLTIRCSFVGMVMIVGCNTIARSRLCR